MPMHSQIVEQQMLRNLIKTHNNGIQRKTSSAVFRIILVGYSSFFLRTMLVGKSACFR